jgi:hypothetical protein
MDMNIQGRKGLERSLTNPRRHSCPRSTYSSLGCEESLFLRFYFYRVAQSRRNNYSSNAIDSNQLQFVKKTSTSVRVRIRGSVHSTWLGKNKMSTEMNSLAEGQNEPEPSCSTYRRQVSHFRWCSSAQHERSVLRSAFSTAGNIIRIQ